MAKVFHIVLELAREPGHPQGDPRHGYHLHLPLTQDGRIDAAAWAELRSLCRVRRFRPGEEDRHGRIVHTQGGNWQFDYDDRSERDDEVGFRLKEEAFVPGEYVSVREDDGRMHTFQVTAVRPE